MTRCAYWSDFDFQHKGSKYGKKYYCSLKIYDQDRGLCYFHSNKEKNENEFFEHFKEFLKIRIKHGLKIFCIGFNFPDVSLYGNEYRGEPDKWNFNNDVFFQKATFKRFYLQEAIFNKNAYFDNATFNGDMEFNFCQFKANASFDKTTWNMNIHLRLAIAGIVTFNECNFNKETKVEINPNIPVYKELTFWQCSFLKHVSFSGSQFKGKNNFSTCTFHDKVNFDQAYFYNQTVYADKTITTFNNCEFKEEVEFFRSNMPPYLEKVIAMYEVPQSLPKQHKFDYYERIRDFFNGRFEANYKEGHYTRVNPWRFQVSSSIINFHIGDRIKYKLLGMNKFKKKFRVKDKIGTTTFVVKNKIDTDIIVNEQKMRAKVFYAEYNFADYNEPPIGFNYSTFRKRVRFVGTVEKPLSLSAVSFKGVDLSNFEFHNVEWIRQRDLLKHRYKVIDELFLEKLQNYDEVSNVYNQLRKNYETKLLFNESSNFFIGEMECIRKSLRRKNNSIYKMSSIPYSLYKIIALYGESIKLPLLWAIAIICGIAGLDYFIFAKYDWMIALKQSAYNFIPISWTLPQELILNNPATVDLYYLEKSFSLIIFGSLFIALRRRFERKK